MGKKEFMKKNLALALAALLALQPIGVWAEDISAENPESFITGDFFSDESGAFVSEERSEVTEENSVNPEGNNIVESGSDIEEDNIVESNSVFESNSIVEEGSSIDSITENYADEPADILAQGYIKEAQSLKWRVDSNSTLCLEGEGTLPTDAASVMTWCLEDGSTVNLYQYSIDTLIIGENISGNLCGGALDYSLKDSLQTVIIKDRGQNVDLKIADNAFSRYTALRKITLGNGISSIGESAFYQCSSLETIEIPDSVETYGGMAFSGCTSLSKAVLSKNAKVISRQMFENCKNLTEIVIPDGVTELGNGALCGISSEADILIPDSVITVGEPYALPQCKVTLPCRFATVGSNNLYLLAGYKFYHMGGVNDFDEDNCTVCPRTGKCGSDAYFSITLSGKMRITGTGAITYTDFSSQYGNEIKSVVIENGIYYLNGFCFDSLPKLESVELADSVKTIQDGTFNKCPKLKKISLGNSFKSDFTATECSGIEEVTVSEDNPNYMTKNGVVYSKDETRLVYYPPNLSGEEFQVPDTVTQISDRAFWYNQNLKKVTISQNVRSCTDGFTNGFQFRSCKSLEEVIINNATDAIPISFCSETASLKKIAIPVGTRKIESSAFYNCENLREVILPASLEKIESYAFDGCYSLSAIHYLGDQESWKKISIGDRNAYLLDADIHYCTIVKDISSGCESGGTRSYKCGSCGITFDVNIPKTEHDFSGWKVVNAPTCTQEGSGILTCQKCGVTKTQSIPKTEHDYEWLAGTEPNCIKTGTDVYQKCKKCGAIKNPPAILPKTGHDYGRWEIVKKETCTEDGEETSICNGCGRVRKRVIKKTGHKWGVWSTTSKATVFKAKKQQRYCLSCGKIETRRTGEKLTPTIQVNVQNITLKDRQSTTKVKVTGLAKGDYIKSWKSSNTKIVKVNSKGKITAQNRAGNATVTVTLGSGKKAVIKVKVQKTAVKTTKLTLPKTATVKVKKTLTLKPVLTPVTSSEKITYTTSNKKIATVNKNGVVTGKKKGTAVITAKSGSKTAKIKVTVR